MTRSAFAAPAAVLLMLAGLCGCDGEPGTLVDDPPLPLRPQDAIPPPAFQDVMPPPAEAAEKTARADADDEPPCPALADAAWVPGKPAQWTHIILHHSATDFGNARVFDRLHRQRNWDELGYHFVIDNGNGGRNGRVEVGPRWIKQKHGAHVRPDPNDDNRWNRHGIGICLVGDFTSERPSAAQLDSAARLVAYLMQACDIPERNILGHNQVPGAQTECPGRLFPYGALMKRVRARLK